MITSNVVLRVFLLIWGTSDADGQPIKSQGTAFTVTHENREFLVTAAHVVRGWPNGLMFISCEVDPKAPFVEVKPRLIGISESSDIAVFDAPNCAKKGLDLPLHVHGTSGMLVGQRVYWIGFPLGFDGGTAPGIGRIGLVGSGVLSGIIPQHSEIRLSDHVVIKNGLIVDGMNNKGYSGGPVIFQSKELRNEDFVVAGVISGTLAANTNYGLMVVGNLKRAFEDVGL